MGWVLADSTTIDGTFYEIGTTPPPDVAARVGAHLRREVEVTAGSAVDEVEDPKPSPIVLADAPGDGSTVFGNEPAPDPQEEDSAAEPSDSEPAEVEQPEQAESQPEADPDPVEPAKPAIAVPNRGGKGSGREHWVEYATAKGISVTDDMERHEIIDACREAGVPVD